MPIGADVVDPFANEVPQSKTPKASEANLSSEYWNKGQATSAAAAHKGISLTELRDEVDKSGLEMLWDYKGPQIPPRVPEIRIPTGTMRPENEGPCVRPHRTSGLTTFVPLPAGESAGKPAAFDYGAALKRLHARLVTVDNASNFDGCPGMLMPTDMLRACQASDMPLDDREIKAAIRRCRPDVLGHVSIDHFIESLRVAELQNQKLHSSAYVAPRLWNPCTDTSKPSTILEPPLPRHAYNCASDPMPTKAKLHGSWQRDGSRDFVERHPFHHRAAWELLPSGTNQTPHRSAAQQQRMLADPRQDRASSLRKLAMSLENYDRTRSGNLPLATVIQFSQLHGFYNEESKPQFHEMLKSCQPKEGARGRVLWKHLIAQLAKLP